MKYAALFLLALASSAQGIFEGSGDVGIIPKPGESTFDAANKSYRITGGGANIWGTADAMRFVWKRVSGDVTLSSDISFEGAGVDPHRKAVLMVRQDLTPGSAYADIAVHGDGLTSLQSRAVARGPTEELKSNLKSPSRVRLERRGNRFMAYAGMPGGEMTPTGPQVVELKDPVYVGIGVSSHNADVLETAVFTGLVLQQPVQYRSKVTIFDLKTRTSKTLYEGDGVIEAPNWSRDGKHLLVNSRGDLLRVPVDGEPKPQKVELSLPGLRCNNDHDYSRDGKRLAFSASSPESRQSQVYVSNADGTGVQLITPAVPSYFHGWSPDGNWLAFVGGRNGKYELFRVPATGGPEERLTSAGAYDDGPEYSPDGKWIYFNSNRGGGWNIWRMPVEGAGPNDAKAEQVTNDAWEDWFPHFSPDGKQMLVFSFPPGTEGHNDRMEGVALRLFPAPGRKANSGKEPVELVKFFGGQGTINVNSWSPDSKRFAYVVYEVVKQ